MKILGLLVAVFFWVNVASALSPEEIDEYLRSGSSLLQRKAVSAASSLSDNEILSRKEKLIAVIEKNPDLLKEDARLRSLLKPFMEAAPEPERPFSVWNFRRALDQKDIPTILTGAKTVPLRDCNPVDLNQFGELGLETQSEAIQSAFLAMLDRFTRSFPSGTEPSLLALARNGVTSEIKLSAGTRVLRSPKLTPEQKADMVNYLLEIEVNKTLTRQILDLIDQGIPPENFRWDVVAQSLSEGTAQRESIMRSFAHPALERHREMLRLHLIPLIPEERLLGWDPHSFTLMRIIRGTNPPPKRPYTPRTCVKNVETPR